MTKGSLMMLYVYYFTRKERVTELNFNFELIKFFLIQKFIPIAACIEKVREKNTNRSKKQSTRLWKAAFRMQN